jgi:hypothetical protein
MPFSFTTIATETIVLGKSIYEAANGSGCDSEAFRLEKRNLTRKNACLTLHGYLESKGLSKDTNPEPRIETWMLSCLAGECIKRFENSSGMIGLDKEDNVVVENIDDHERALEASNKVLNHYRNRGIS